MHLYELYTRAADRLENNGWVQGSYLREDGSACLVGSINAELQAEKPLFRNMPDFIDGIRDLPSDIRAEVILAIRQVKVFGRRPFKEVGLTTDYSIMGWNDHGRRKKSQVVGVLRSLADKHHDDYVAQLKVLEAANKAAMEAEIVEINKHFKTIVAEHENAPVKDPVSV